jgi:hypothetical protein
MWCKQLGGSYWQQVKQAQGTVTWVCCCLTVIKDRFFCWKSLSAACPATELLATLLLCLELKLDSDIAIEGCRKAIIHYAKPME